MNINEIRQRRFEVWDRLDKIRKGDRWESISSEISRQWTERKKEFESRYPKHRYDGPGFLFWLSFMNGDDIIPDWASSEFVEYLELNEEYRSLEKEINDLSRKNLNICDIPRDDYCYAPFNRDTIVHNGNVSVYFDNLQNRLIEHIAAADTIVGCVAWLTNEHIISALSGKRVSFIVQKEDFLRPDCNSSGWKKQLSDLYNSLDSSIYKWEMPGILGHISCKTVDVDSIRCLGNHNSIKKKTRPLMHHKFAVFCKPCDENSIEYADYLNSIERSIGYGPPHLPYAVWTGSFNFTANSTHSLENAVYINDPKIAMAYYNEWVFAYALSEPLDWTSEWVEPEYRLGT